MSDKEMSRRDIGMLGFEIVAYSGDARSSLLEALKDARNGKFDGLEEKIQAAQENLKNRVASSCGFVHLLKP